MTGLIYLSPCGDSSSPRRPRGDGVEAGRLASSSGTPMPAWEDEFSFDRLGILSGEDARLLVAGSRFAERAGGGEATNAGVFIGVQGGYRAVHAAEHGVLAVEKGRQMLPRTSPRPDIPGKAFYQSSSTLPRNRAESSETARAAAARSWQWC
ncbi:hypothetical protein BU16DRAFT_233023 [Lophium mytilinum]|uniref:Uncharacterized protein n=1 Tax=Lophium mytilinum TaxID=390894 RepID=A0A6A6R5Y9_9PEZI|nr:hypothetical protein BU16DRAFT_233023 [Lophium mytilinum]